MKKRLHAIRRDINRVFYLSLINRYDPRYEGSLQPLSLRDLQTLQLYGENASAWKLLHGHWRRSQLQTYTAWKDQTQRNVKLLAALLDKITKKRNFLGLKGPILRKLARLRRFYRWQLEGRKQEIRRKTFLRETGLGSYFYRMHLAGRKWQIS